MANIYVSPAGAGTQSGADLANAMAWATFEAGALTTLNPGDNVYCADGTYTRTSTITVARSGTGTAGTYTSTAPITFTYATTARGPHFQGPDYSGGPGTLTDFRGFLITGTDVHLVGLKISRMPRDGVRVENSRCTIDNCYLLRNGMIRSDGQDGGEGVMISGIGDFCTVKASLFVENREHAVYAAGEVDDVMIGGTLAADGNIFRYNGYDWDGAPAKLSGTSAIQANGNGPGDGCNRITVQNNHVYYSSKRGILFLETHGSTITGNYVYGNAGDQILVDSVSNGNTVTDNQIASDTRGCITIKGSAGAGHTVTGNRCWTEATANSANVAIDFADVAKIAVSGTNIFHHAGPSVARDSSPAVIYYALAAYMALAGDATSTETTGSSGFHADIVAWIAAGGGVALPPDPAADADDPVTDPTYVNPLINALDFLLDNQVTGGYRGTFMHLFTWATFPGTAVPIEILLLRPCATLTERARMTAAITERARLAGTVTERARMTATLTRRGCTD